MHAHLPLVALLMATLFVAGCAKSAHELAADYVSPLEYQGYSCKNLRGELRRVSSQVISYLSLWIAMLPQIRSKWLSGWCCFGPPYSS